MKKPARPHRPHAPRREKRPIDETPAAENKQASLPRRGEPTPRGIRKPRAQEGSTASGMPEQPRTKGSWAKSPSERLAAGRQRSSGSPRRPSEHPRDTHRRSQNGTPAAASVSVGGVEISVRTIFILIMMSLLLSLILPSLYQWWKQEQEYREIVAQYEAAVAANEEARRTLELWNNPDFVASQARERLGYVRPGETQYSVVDPGPEYRDKLEQSIAPSRGPAKPWIHHFAIFTQNADVTSSLPEGSSLVTNPPAQSPQSDGVQSNADQSGGEESPLETASEQGQGGEVEVPPAEENE